MRIGIHYGPAIVGEALSQAGFDPQVVLALTAEAAVKDALRANTEEAVRRGAFGAPSMFVGDVLFWGNDRLPLLEQHLTRRA